MEIEFIEHLIFTDSYFFQSIFSADVNSDGAIDVLSVSSTGDVIWFENDGSENFVKHTIADSFEYTESVYAVDIDSDGDIDVLAAAAIADDITWQTKGAAPRSPQKQILSPHIL